MNWKFTDIFTHLHTNRHLAICTLTTFWTGQDDQDSIQDIQDSHKESQDIQDSHMGSQDNHQDSHKMQ